MKPKLNIEFHNPNTDEIAAKFIAKIFIKVSQEKFEKILKAHTEKIILRE